MRLSFLVDGGMGGVQNANAKSGSEISNLGCRAEPEMQNAKCKMQNQRTGEREPKKVFFKNPFVGRCILGICMQNITMK